MPQPRKRVKISTSDIGISDARQHNDNHDINVASQRDDESPTSDLAQSVRTYLEGANPSLQGHTYGPLTATGKARVQMGDANYTVGSGSTVNGPSMVAGDFNVKVRNAFYNCNHDRLQQKTESEKVSALKYALYFNTMDDRRAQLHDVSPDSLEWIWSSTQFPDWLRSQLGIFCITGKPGSGKSTLMHHLTSNKAAIGRTKQHLHTNGQQWVLLHFYFDFRAGEGIANTPIGMLRAFLYQLVDHSPGVQAFVTQECGHRLGGNWPTLQPELLKLVSQAVKIVGLSVCGFIDGLDEYTGKLRDLADTIACLQKTGNMKLCLASRPRTELEHKFHSCPGMLMQDHNHATVDRYVEASLASIKQFIDVSSLRNTVGKVKVRAEGVVLWAWFAVNEVVDAALRGCTLYEIERCLDALPSELEGIYERIWTRLSYKERLEAAVLFFIIEHWHSSFGDHMSRDGKISIDTYYYLSLEHCMLLWCRTIQELEPSARIGPEFTSHQFQLRVHATVKGLVEFTRTGDEVKLLHKTLKTFLSRSQSYNDTLMQVTKVLDPDALGPRFYAQTLRDASQDQEPVSNLDYLPSGAYNDSMWKQPYGLKMHPPAPALMQQFLDTSGMRQYTSSSVGVALHCLHQMAVLDEPQHLYLLLSATRGWLFRRFGASFDWQRVVEKLVENHPRAKWLSKHPEALSYIWTCSHENAFRATLREFGADLGFEDKNLLFAITITRWVDRTVGMDINKLPQILITLLQEMHWQASYFALSICVSRGADFDQIPIKTNASSTSDHFFYPSAWWPHHKMHVLCVWAWSPLIDHDHETFGRVSQKLLEFALSIGANIDDQIYDGGTVLHALFDEAPWSASTYVPNLFAFDRSWIVNTHLLHRDLRFSLEKFTAILNCGINLCAAEKYGSVTKAAVVCFERMRRGLRQLDFNTSAPMACFILEMQLTVLQELKLRQCRDHSSCGRH